MRDAIRLDELLVERGFFKDVKTARSWIMSGKVLVRENREDKPGLIVKKDAVIRVKGMDCPYVSRGGLKLEAALKAFNIKVDGRCAIDAGACTGGFTDCLLKHNIAKVYSVEVGFGQLAGSIMQDPRVVNMEKTNIGDVRSEMLDPRPNLGVMDLSYLSLTKALGIVSNLLHPDDMGCGKEMIALVKPLFEVKVRSHEELTEKSYVDAIVSAIEAGRECGMKAVGLINSPILGSKGTLEFLIHYSENGNAICDDEIENTVAKGILLLSE